jgi:hypothetical protein
MSTSIIRAGVKSRCINIIKVDRTTLYDEGITDVGRRHIITNACQSANTDEKAYQRQE